MAIGLQTIIGTDKRNPLFTICRTNDSKEIYVYYGAALLEIIKDDKNDPAFKLLLARLYNARVNCSIMVKKFGIARTTMKRWGDALRSGDHERLVTALSGSGSPRKLTAEIRQFVTVRFQDIYRQTHYNYSAVIRQEIEKIFKKKISGETLRPLFKALKAKYFSSQSNIEQTESTKEDNKRSPSCDSNIDQSQLPEATNDQESNRLNGYNQPDSAADVAGDNNNNRNHTIKLPLVDNVTGFSHHLGVLIFSPLLAKLNEFITTGNRLILQWVVMVLLGAKNIEQTKLIDFESLKLILPDVTTNLNSQRTLLSQLASNNVVSELIKFNAELISANSGRDFYYDPHTKRYTGLKKILKGWCPNIRMADKALHLDFIHTSEGHPLYVDHNDNYYDLRKRFPQTIARFRQQAAIDESAILTYIVDRGIYSIASFTDIIEDSNSHIITWEKGYQQDQWDAEQTIEKFYLYKYKNNNENLLKYKFEYIDLKWSRDPRMRQLIVRATNPKEKTIEVSILADDLTRNGMEIIQLIFSRWIQENDFKYLEKHFGINQITSYKSISYRQLQGLLDDQQVVRGEYKAYQQQALKIKSKLKNLLLTKHRNEKSDCKREQKITQLINELNDVEQTISKTQKEQSKLQLLIEQQYLQLNTDNKLVMDYIKIVARNMFYICLAPFKTEYNNFRDDHVLFRNLTHSHGYVSISGDEISVTLYPTVNYQPKVRNIINGLLEKINESKPVFPDGSNRTFRLKLGEKTSNLFAIPN
jgi:hypothetical protein